MVGRLKGTFSLADPQAFIKDKFIPRRAPCGGVFSCICAPNDNVALRWWVFGRVSRRQHRVFAGWVEMMRKIAGVGILMGLSALSACVDRSGDTPNLSAVCRPDGVAPAQLQIGEVAVPRDQLVAQLQHSPITGEYGVSINLAEEYALAVAQITRESLGQALPLRLDEELIAEPVVNTPILSGNVLISGNYTRSAASDIVARLSGPCPVQTGG